MDTIPGSNPMENPPHSPLGGLDPADLLKQGAAEDTFMDGAANSFNPPSIEELAAIFPQFEILELIGQGGMGAVYKVRQKDLDRVVALKILPPAIGQSEEFSNRFTREAKALAKLNHPGIVTIHEFGQQDGLYFILMEFVDGVNLAQLMKTGRISPREALAIIPQICDALQFAHDQGIVHRDIKPENILLDRLGRVKVADFGIAKVVAAVCDPIRSGDTPVPTEATLHGKILGTPQYMAPEQITHPAEVDHRADIYALGVVFYQMLTGELPGKRLEVPSKKVHIDVRLDEIVLRAMEKEPELRYQTAHEFRTVVDGVQAPAQALPPSSSQPPPKRGMLRWWWVFLIMFPLGLLIGLAAASGLTYFTPKQYEVQTIIELRPRDGTTQTSNFFATEFEAIKSRKSLAAVVEQLDLSKSWRISQDSAVQKLTTIIQAQNIGGTDLISISVRHTNKQDAAAIAKAVTLNYQRSFPERVVIHEEPSEPNTPRSPNVRLNLVIGGLLGLILSPLLGIILIAILQLLFPETKSINSPRQPRQQASVMKTCEDELVAPRAVPASPIVKERSTAKIIAVGCGVLALVVVVGLVGLSTVFWFYTELRHDTARGKTQAARQETRESIARAEQNSKEVNERSHTSPNSKETPKKLDTHPLLMTEFGEFKSEQSPWRIHVSAEDRKLQISRQLGGIGTGISPDYWRAQNGWFAFIEDENHAWAYDGGEKLMLVEVTPEKSTVYETEMILRTVPDAILPRISQSTRDKIGIKSTPESRRLANRLSETEVAVPAGRRQAGIAAGNHGESGNDAAKFFPSAITESAWVVPFGLMLSLLLAIILIAILRRLFPKTKTENSALQANRQASSKDQVAEKVNVAGNDSSRTQTHVDSFAVTSLVFGIVSLVLGPLGSLPAIIFGHVALSRIKTNSSLTGRGYALAGVVLGYTTLVLLVMAIVVLISLRPVSSNHASSSNGDIPVKASGYFVR